MSPDRKTLLEALRERLDGGSFEHCERVADTAAGLAGSYGVDVEKAWAAGLLHDWDRDLSGEETIARAHESGIEVTEVDRQVPYLLHARTGATDVAIRFPSLAADVIRAIERHTIGHVDMQPLDMVVFIADSIEPARHWAGVDALRARVGSEPLRRLFFFAYRHSLGHLVEAGRLVHPQTVTVWNALVSGGER